ncbi:MAG: cysteine hydrolase family protein [Methanomicrobium sp.]|nr:cysteine hydrolase family protein [Methanomicrobium sp.]
MVSALLLVDIQNDYFPGGNMELFTMNEAAKNAQKLLLFFRKEKMPVIHVQHISKREGAGFFLPKTFGAEINEMVTPVAGEEIVVKNSPNSFLNTDLLSILKKKGLSDIVICGAMSNMCIDATTRAASDAGFACTVISDACAAKSLEFGGVSVPAEIVHASFMAALSGVYAKVIDLESFLKERIKD